MSRDPWIERKDVIRTQLALQVDLSFRAHHRFMLGYGLDQCKSVIDIGTGNGLFLEKIARKHPEIKFQGIDSKSHMIDEAKSRDAKNINWVQADALDESVKTILGAADGVLMRYTVLHLPNTSDSLPRIFRRVRRGTFLWIFDLDTDYCICEPVHHAYTSFYRLLRSFCERNAVEIRTASILPPILERTGFQVREILVEPFNNREVDPNRFAEYLLREAALYHYFLKGTHSSKELLDLESFLFHEMNRDTYFVQYGMVMIGATRLSTDSRRGRKQ